MIRHLVHLIWNQRKRNGWIVAELLFVFIVLWFVTDTLFVVANVYFSPLGMSTDHVYRLNYQVAGKNAGEETDSALLHTTAGQDLLTMVSRVRTYPGVEAVAVTDNGLPFDGNTRYSKVYINDSTGQGVRIMTVTPDFFNVFQIGKSEDEKRSWSEMMEAGRKVLSYDLQAWLKREGGDKNSPLYLSRKLSTARRIVWEGATAPMRAHWFCRDAFWIFAPLTQEQIAAADGSPSLSVIFRVKPENDSPRFADEFVEKMGTALSLGRAYLMDITPYRLQVESYEILDGTKGELQKHIVIMVFLLFNIFLGIIGTFWFRTEQRKGEMGLRIALGSTRRHLGEFLAAEGLLLLTLVAVPAFLVCLNIHLAELTWGEEWMDYTFLRLLTGFGITYLLLAVMILLGIGYPAMRTARLEVADALHYE